MRTHDATRVSFLSADPEVFYQPMCQAVNPLDFLPELDLFGRETLGEKESKQPKNAEEKLDSTQQEDKQEGPVYAEIRSKLGKKPSKPYKREQEVIVPAILEEISSEIQEALEKEGIHVEEIRDIQFGKKWRGKYQVAIGEVNVFYGKRGFSVVQTPKRDTSADMNAWMAGIISEVIYHLERTPEEVDDMPF
jgi:hypothetical protein